MDRSFEGDVRELIRECGIKQATIDELANLVCDSVEVPAEFSRTATIDRIKKVVRQQIKTIRTPDGLAQFESIERLDENGNPERVYANLSLFDKNDYQTTISYYAERCRYHGRKANALTKRCNDQHGTQLPLPFPEFGSFGDDVEGAA